MSDNIIPAPPATQTPRQVGPWSAIGKPAWQSKAMWSGVVTIALAVCAFSDQYFHTNIMGSPFYKYAMTIAGILGVYGRATADAPITSFI
jgi:hypothetical protein